MKEPVEVPAPPGALNVVLALGFVSGGVALQWAASRAQSVEVWLACGVAFSMGMPRAMRAPFSKSSSWAASAASRSSSTSCSRGAIQFNAVLRRVHLRHLDWRYFVVESPLPMEIHCRVFSFACSTIRT